MSDKDLKQWVIRSRTDLAHFVSHRRDFNSVELHIAHIDKAARQSLEKRLNHLLHACGCTAGSICLIVTILVCAVLLPLRVHQQTLSVTQAFLWGLAACTIAMLGGKLLGLAAAHWRWKRTITQLYERIGA